MKWERKYEFLKTTGVTLRLFLGKKPIGSDEFYKTYRVNHNWFLKVVKWLLISQNVKIWDVVYLFVLLLLIIIVDPTCFGINKKSIPNVMNSSKTFELKQSRSIFSDKR